VEKNEKEIGPAIGKTGIKTHPYPLRQF
jgi:hypothetical protein